MRRFLARAVLLVVPLALLAAIQLAVPLDAFCFRTWEALEVKYRTHDVVGLGPLHMPPVTALPGPFVPGVRFERVEVGDLGHHTPYAVPRPVVWVTDAHGYRTTPATEPPHVVVVGDSNVVGNGLTQADTLADVLHTEHGFLTYAFAPRSIESYAAEPRFMATPPARVVLTCIERNVLDTFAPEGTPPAALPLARPVNNRLLFASDMAVNRLYKFPMLEWARARINGRRAPIEGGGMLFLHGAAANAAPDPVRVRTAAATLGRWARRLRDRGTRLSVLIVPNKETTYADVLPGAAPSTLISALRDALSTEGVALIDVQTDFAAARAAGQPPFQVDDTHWSSHGVRLAARRIAAWTETTDPEQPAAR